VHHVGILYDQIMMHGQRNIKSDEQLTVLLQKLPVAKPVRKDSAFYGTQQFYVATLKLRPSTHYT